MIPNLRKAVAQGPVGEPAVRLSSSQPLSQHLTDVTTTTTGDGSLPDRLEIESLLINVDASLRVHARHQLFSWTQGLLQNLIKHELLICALRDGEPLMFQVDSFTAAPLEPEHISETFQRDTSLVPHLVKIWEDNWFRPTFLEAGDGSQFAQTPLARELMRIGATRVLAHGTYDVFGKVATFFAFACKPDTVGQRQVYLAELIVPFLHLAWVRTQVSRPAAQGTGTAAVAPALLTSREREILRWIHLGKSNIEIGAILGISPLTVKNHVQKILRKLNVQNRAQAVGRGLALRILSL